MFKIIFLEALLGPKNGTVTLSCRIDKSVYDLLSAEAEKRGISLNSLVNSITKKYASWEKNAEQVGFIPLSKKAIASIFDELDLVVLKKIANDVGSTIPRTLIMLNFNSLDFKNIITTIDIWAARFGSIRHDVRNTKHIITIYHNVNENFSRYIAEVHKAMASDLKFKINITSITQDAVAMEIDAPTGVFS